jgi:hypothetical protein
MLRFTDLSCTIPDEKVHNHKDFLLSRFLIHTYNKSCYSYVGHHHVYFLLVRAIIGLETRGSRC